MQQQNRQNYATQLKVWPQIWIGLATQSRNCTRVTLRPNAEEWMGIFLPNGSNVPRIGHHVTMLHTTVSPCYHVTTFHILRSINGPKIARPVTRVSDKGCSCEKMITWVHICRDLNHVLEGSQNKFKCIIFLREISFWWKSLCADCSNIQFIHLGRGPVQDEWVWAWMSDHGRAPVSWVGRGLTWVFEAGNGLPPPLSIPLHLLHLTSPANHLTGCAAGLKTYLTHTTVEPSATFQGVSPVLKLVYNSDNAILVLLLSKNGKRTFTMTKHISLGPWGHCEACPRIVFENMTCIVQKQRKGSQNGRQKS